MIKTDKNLRNERIYSIFIRNFTEEGTFKAATARIKDLKDMGFSTIWMLPIHPTGEKNRKGTLGSPYSIKDYFAIDESLGNFDDFNNFMQEVKNNGMKLMMDIVFHHTSWDNELIETHNDFYYHKENGKIGNKVGEWSDIADFDFENKELYRYLISVLRFWAEKGIDGFRCDVAPLIPLDFWIEARKTLEEEGYNLIWLSESVEPSFIVYLREQGFTAHSDSEMYQAFDMLYDYDIKNDNIDFYENRIGIKSFIKNIERQEFIYPENYVKLRFLENHDNPNARLTIRDNRRRKNILFFMYMLKGAFLFYNGEETNQMNQISLFDKDSITWDYDGEIIEDIKFLNKLKAQKIMSHGSMILKAITENIVEVRRDFEGKSIIAFLNIGEKEETLEFDEDIAVKFLYKNKSGLSMPIVMEMEV